MEFWTSARLNPNLWPPRLREHLCLKFTPGGASPAPTRKKQDGDKEPCGGERQDGDKKRRGGKRRDGDEERRGGKGQDGDVKSPLQSEERTIGASGICSWVGRRLGLWRRIWRWGSRG